jgi:ElaA protein
MLHWHWQRFERLSVDALYDLLALRAEVFVREQHCVYVDPDGRDRRAWHLMGRDDAAVLQAGLRVVDPGLTYAEPSIGRVVTAAAVRGRGIGRALMLEGLARTDAQWPRQGIRISAQAHLQHFYGTLGFTPVGEPYLEDGIAHQEMLRRPS